MGLVQPPPIPPETLCDRCPTRPPHRASACPLRDPVEPPAPDLVNHPPHYKTASGLEAIDVIEAFELDFHLGNAVKYCLRAGKKDPTKTVQDLQKAIWYINRRIGKEA